MPLYIRDDSVDDLAKKVMRVTGAANKTEAVRLALQARLETEKAKKSLLERIMECQAMADEIGKPDPSFDQKTFSDDMWGDE